MVARYGTIREASVRLSVSHTVVSRHIHNLEAALGVKLLRKSGRGVVLTEEGARLAARFRKAFDILAQAREEAQQSVEEALHICCGAAMAAQKLLASLPELKARLGSRDVILQPNNNRTSLSQEKVDAELIYLRGEQQFAEMRSLLIARPRIIPIASPEFKLRHHHVRKPADLLTVPLLHEQTTAQWEDWLHQAKVDDVPRLSGAQLWHGQLTLEAARLGQGVALVSELIAEVEIAQGRLIEIIPTEVFLGGFYFVAPERTWDSAALVAVREWLFDIFGRVTAPTIT